MPKLHKKIPVLDGHAHVLSYERDPSTWFYRELIKGTKTYRSVKIEDASSESEAKTAAMKIALEFAKVAPEVKPKVHSQSTAHAKTGRQRKVLIADAVAEFLLKVEQKVAVDEISGETLKSKTITLQRHMLRYLEEKGIEYSNQLKHDTFDDWHVFRIDEAKSKLTRNKEQSGIKDFIDNHLIRYQLAPIEVVQTKKLVPLQKVRKDELTANPRIIREDWDVLRDYIRKDFYREGLESPNLSVKYWRKLFYVFIITMRHSGCRPKELLALKWKDISFVDIEDFSEDKYEEDLLRNEEELQQLQSEGFEIIDEGTPADAGRVVQLNANLFIRKSKTVVARSVPCNKTVANNLIKWRAYINEWFKSKQYTRKVEEDDYVFGRGSNDLQPYYYQQFEKTWRSIRRHHEHRSLIKGNPFSENPYTIYSLRSTYIENQLENGVSILLVARACGHSVAVLERHYERMNVLKQARELTHIELGKSKELKTREVRPWND